MTGTQPVFGELLLRDRSVRPGELLVMAIVNRTPDSFYDRGATYAEQAALDRVRTVVGQGADLVDIGGVKAGYGRFVSVEEEIDRTAGFVARVRSEFPDLPISVDTWRHEVGRAVCEAGADVLNDAWGGHDPELAAVAAEFGAGIVCCHTGGLAPRTDPHRPQYDDLMGEVLAATTGLAERAVALGVDPRRVVIDPCHDFGKNTWHSLEVTRRLGEMAATGWPVLVSLSNKDFVGESLGAELPDRLPGTLAASAVSAWLGATIFRAHNVPETRMTLDMVATIRGDRPPVRAVRGLA
ncbi:dihydropteroate synthase [Nakamurella sp. YIM 132087]|uniref:Dihydropteroate synthase n=1 Tax=Nakamurella alba TaxID=2665158 RepID=A0A7K1FUG5_9ACTN|nr:dihydropteroate synthase [Nakamurella alba]MTD16474.1 dihydropteroate synthase [Nakamurella alba]